MNTVEEFIGEMLDTGLARLDLDQLLGHVEYLEEEVSRVFPKSKYRLTKDGWDVIYGKVLQS